MLLILIQPDVIRQFPNRAIDPGPEIAILADFFQHFLMLAFSPSNDRRQQSQSRSFSLCHERVHHLLHGLLGDWFAAVRAMWPTGPGIQQPKIIVYFCNRSHCGSRIATGRFLVNRYRRRQSLDIIHVRLIHLPEKLPGIGRQRLDIPALSLGINSIERQ